MLGGVEEWGWRAEVSDGVQPNSFRRARVGSWYLQIQPLQIQPTMGQVLEL